MAVDVGKQAGASGVDDELLDIKQLAKMLKVSEQWLYNRTRFNEIPCVRVGRLVRFRRSDIDAFLERQASDGQGFVPKEVRRRAPGGGRKKTSV